MRNLKSIASAVAFMVLWAGAAIAMPTTFFSNDDERTSTVADLVSDDDLDGVASGLQGETDEVTVPEEDPDEDEGDGEGDRESRPDNHGKAVSTAAHCKLTGRAKGALVSSIARDRSATAETAQAACDAAKAEAEAAGSTKPAKPGKPAMPGKPAKPEKVAKPRPAPKPQAPQSSETESSGGDGSSTEDAPAPPGPPAGSGPPADKGAKKP